MYNKSIRFFALLYPRSTGGGILIPPLHRKGVYCFTSVRPSVLPSVPPSFRLSFRLSQDIFRRIFLSSATINDRNLIFGHNLHIGMSYRGKRFWTHQIPTSCLPTWLVFIHIEHICGGTYRANYKKRKRHSVNGTKDTKENALLNTIWQLFWIY
jgi:hypothetical protein